MIQIKLKVSDRDGNETEVTAWPSDLVALERAYNIQLTDFANDAKLEWVAHLAWTASGTTDDFETYLKTIGNIEAVDIPLVPTA